MFGGSFLGLGATAGGLLGSAKSGGGVTSWTAEGDRAWGLFGGSSGVAEAVSTKTVGFGLGNPADRGGSFASSGSGGATGSSMKSEGGGIRLRSISEDLGVSLWPSPSLDKHTG